MKPILCCTLQEVEQHHGEEVRSVPCPEHRHGSEEDSLFIQNQLAFQHFLRFTSPIIRAAPPGGAGGNMVWQTVDKEESGVQLLDRLLSLGPCFLNCKNERLVFLKDLFHSEFQQQNDFESNFSITQTFFCAKLLISGSLCNLRIFSIVSHSEYPPDSWTLSSQGEVTASGPASADTSVSKTGTWLHEARVCDDPTSEQLSAHTGLAGSEKQRLRKKSRTTED